MTLDVGGRRLARVLAIRVRLDTVGVLWLCSGRPGQAAICYLLDNTKQRAKEKRFKISFQGKSILAILASPTSSLIRLILNPQYNLVHLKIRFHQHDCVQTATATVRYQPRRHPEDPCLCATSDRAT